MAAQLTTYGAKYFMHSLFGRTKTPAATTYFGLSLSAPLDSTNGSGLNEPSAAGGYSRVSYSNVATGFAVNVFAKKIESNVVTLLCDSSHGLAANQTVYVYLNDTQFDKNRKFVNNWSAEYATLATAATNSLTYNLTTTNLGGAVSTASRSSNVVTLNTSSAHNLTVGQTIWVTGVTTISSSIFTVLSVTSTSVTFTSPGTDNASLTVSSGAIYAMTSGTVTPFYNVVGTRQVSNGQATLYTDATVGSDIVTSSQLQIFAGQSSATPTSTSNAPLVGLSIGQQFVTNNVTTFGTTPFSPSQNLLSYVNSTFEGSTTAARTDTWTVNTGTGSASIDEKTSVGDFKALSFNATTAGTSTILESATVAVTAGTKYGVGIDFLNSVAATSVTLQILWSNATTTAVQTLSSVPASTTTWTTLYDTVDAPAGVTTAKIQIAYTRASSTAILKIRKPIIALAPTLSSITGATGTGTNYVFRVSAITPTGETVPSNPITAQTASGSLTLTWASFATASSYRIYAAYNVTEDSVAQQPYINSQLVATATGTSTAFPITSVPTTGFTKTRVNNWFPGGNVINITKNVSNVEAASYTSDTVVSPSSGGIFSYVKLLPYWQPSIDGKIYNGRTVKFTATADWGPIGYWFMSETSTGGNVIAFGELSDTIYIYSGDSVTIPTNGISFNVFSGYGA